MNDSTILRAMKLVSDMNASGNILMACMSGLSVEELSAIPVGANPFHHDSYHMGTSVGNLTVMYSNHDASDYLILVFPNGKRIKINYADYAKLEETASEGCTSV